MVPVYIGELTCIIWALTKKSSSSHAFSHSATVSVEFPLIFVESIERMPDTALTNDFERDAGEKIIHVDDGSCLNRVSCALGSAQS